MYTSAYHGREYGHLYAGLYASAEGAAGDAGASCGRLFRDVQAGSAATERYLPPHELLSSGGRCAGRHYLSAGQELYGVASGV